MIAEGHDVLVLVMLPFQEGTIHAIDIEARVVGLLDQRFHVIALEKNHVLITFQRFLACTPRQTVCTHRVQ